MTRTATTGGSSRCVAARAHLLFTAALGAGFLMVAVAYIAASSREGWRLPHRATGMPAMWAALLAATALLAEVAAQRQQQQQQQTYTTAVRVVQGLLLLMLATATVALASTKDTHGAVWAALAAASVGAVMLSSRRLTKVGEPTSTPVVPLKASDDNAAAPPAASAGPPTTSTQPPPPPPTRLRRCARCCCLWTLLTIAAMIAVAFGVGAAMTAQERVLYPAPGKHFLLQTSAPGDDGGNDDEAATVRMHMHCLGERADATRPIIVFEHGGGSSSFTFFGVQQRLAAQGVRSCAYDRPGFGWSEPLPVGAESLGTYHRLLSSLLAAAGEAPPYILAGHSAGVELVLVYAHAHPEAVAAVSLLDGYPDYLLLNGLSEAQAKQQEARICGILQVARAFEGAGLLRPIFLRRPVFEPPSEAARQSSTYTNGHNFDSQWRVFCRAQTPRATAFLTAVAEALPPAQQGGNPSTAHVKWPRLAEGVQVQIISAGSTVRPTPAKGQINMYWAQADAYNKTLASPSGQSEWLVCDDCTHGFPYEKTEYLAEQLVRLYQRV